MCVENQTQTERKDLKQSCDNIDLKIFQEGNFVWLVGFFFLSVGTFMDHTDFEECVHQEDAAVSCFRP